MNATDDGPPISSPADVIAFWRDAGPDAWFSKDEAFDESIRRRFMPTWRAACEGRLAAWEDGDQSVLALIIVLDQFPRNMFRDDVRAYASDAAALALAKRAIDDGLDARVDRPMRQFVYMPLMHSEQPADQDACVALFRRHGDPRNLKYAELHQDIIQRFGRFPHRNRVLARSTTEAERLFLEAGGFAG